MNEHVPSSGTFEGDERRVSPRKPVTRKVDLSIRKGTLGLTPEIGLMVIDASEDGIGVRLTAPLNVGDEVAIVLSFPVTSKTIKVVGEVLWCEPRRFKIFAAGIRLRRRLTHAEIAELH